MAAKPTPDRKSRSGSYVHETQRGTIRVRVPRDEAEALAKRWACEPGEAVLRAVTEAIDR